MVRRNFESYRSQTLCVDSRTSSIARRLLAVSGRVFSRPTGSCNPPPEGRAKPQVCFRFQVCFQGMIGPYWKRHGFASLPRSSRVGANALSARDCLSALPCWDRASKMVDAGYMPGQIATFIRDQNGDGHEYTLLTLKKYIQLYRRHFVSPAAALIKGTVERVKDREVEARKARDEGRKAGVPSARELKGDVRDAERKTKDENKKNAASKSASAARKKSGNSIAAPGGGDSGAGAGARRPRPQPRCSAIFGVWTT